MPGGREWLGKGRYTYEGPIGGRCQDNGMRVRACSAVGFAPVLDAHDGHRLGVIVDLIEDALVAHPDASPLQRSGQLAHAVGTRVAAQGRNPLRQWLYGIYSGGGL